MASPRCDGSLFFLAAPLVEIRSAGSAEILSQKVRANIDIHHHLQIMNASERSSPQKRSTKYWYMQASKHR